MPARLVQVTLINNSDYPIIWQEDGRDHGDWQEPWYPSNIKNLKKGEKGVFRLESDTWWGGVKGWVLFKVDVPVSNVGVRNEFFYLSFKRAFIILPILGDKFEHMAGDIMRRDPRTNDLPHFPPNLTYVKDHGFTDLGNADHVNLVEYLLAGLFPPVTGPIMLMNDMTSKQVAWVVEVVNTLPTSTLPLRVQVAPQGVIYGVMPIVEATFDVTRGVIPAFGGDLMWYRHIGRKDGSFKWAPKTGKTVGRGWGEFTHVFSGGDGVIYAVTPIVEASFDVNDGPIPASGGDLMWYRHIGWEDGSFNWAAGKKVGTGWGEFTHVFSGGDGVIYAVTPIVEASFDVNDGPIPASGGDLIWYRHIGREDGSFALEGPKKVGTGWGEFTHVFSGGDGIIYGVTPIVEASFDVNRGPIPASGGDLMWYGHIGREDGSFKWVSNKGRKVGIGWNFKHVFHAGTGMDNKNRSGCMALSSFFLFFFLFGLIFFLKLIF